MDPSGQPTYVGDQDRAHLSFDRATSVQPDLGWESGLYEMPQHAGSVGGPAKPILGAVRSVGQHLGVQPDPCRHGERPALHVTQIDSAPSPSGG